MSRNYGIDLLRLIAMYLVVILHVLGAGGVLANADNGQYYISWFLEVMAYCAVDIYAIITGYVCYREKEKPYQYTKYILFWLPVFIYSFGITFAGFIFRPESFAVKDLIRAALPVATSEYWYVNAYTALFFVIPWVNKLIRNLTKKELNQLIIVLFCVFSVYATFATAVGSDPFSLIGGYSFIWLLVLYVVGAWIKKNGINVRLKKVFWIILIIFPVIIAWLFKMFSPVANGVFVSYISPAVAIEAVSFVALFSGIKLNQKVVSVVKRLSPAAFGVYLIHVHPLIWTRVITNSFSWIARSSPLILVLQVLGCALVIFSVCLLIELIRLTIFKFLNIDNFILERVNRITEKRSDGRRAA